MLLLFFPKKDNKKNTRILCNFWFIFYIFLCPDLTLSNSAETLKLLMTLSESHEILLGGSVAHL